MLGFPRHAFTTVTDFFEQWPHRGELVIDLTIIALNHGHRWHGFTRNRIAFAFFPVFHIKRLT